MSSERHRGIHILRMMNTDDDDANGGGETQHTVSQEYSFGWL